MSAVLHVGKTINSCYDCIVESSVGAKEKIDREWFCVKTSGYFSLCGPWKIVISDASLFLQIENDLVEMFDDLGYVFPDEVSVISFGDKVVRKPSLGELHALLGVV
jgi:hypothetical protein